MKWPSRGQASEEAAGPWRRCFAAVDSAELRLSRRSVARGQSRLAPSKTALNIGSDLYID